ncbi:MAG: hypothetical protein ABIJ97_09335 [Bacteroidota bacterium]
MKYLFCFILLSFIIISCNKEVDEELKNYYSCGVISSDVVSYNTKKVILKVRFFVLDKSNNEELINSDILNNLYPSDLSYYGTLDSLKMVFTPEIGNYSAAVLMSTGLDQDANTRDYFLIMEPTIRKFLKTSCPENEVMLAKIGDKSKPLEILVNGYTTNAEELDIPLAEIYKNGNYPATDTLYLLDALDSMINYMDQKSLFNNKHLIIVYSRRKVFLENFNLDTIINKASEKGVTCHLLESTPSYNTWVNNDLKKFLFKLNAKTNGMYYASPFWYSFDWGELPMDMLLMSARLGDILNGKFECFEAVWTITSDYPVFYLYTSHSWDFSINLKTNYEQQNISVPFNFYID